MEKQRLIKYYCAVGLMIVLFAGSNKAAMGESTTPPSISPTETTSPVLTHSASQDTNSDNNMLPLLLSIVALAVSGGAIALTILKNKQIGRSIDSLKKKHTDELKSFDNKYIGLLNSQVNSPLSQQRELISYNSSASNNNAYLEAMIERLSERINEIEENKLQVTKKKEPSINYSKNTYQSLNLDPSFNPFEQNVNLSQSENITQPLENLAYIELVNTYNNNPKLLEQKAIKVSEPTDSINRRHTDSSQKIILEKANNSNYWVIHDDVGIDCWLLPKNKLKIDQYRYETTKALFECNGYQAEYLSFKLVKPAKVIPLSVDEQTWQLEEPGILEFSVEA